MMFSTARPPKEDDALDTDSGEQRTPQTRALMHHEALWRSLVDCPLRAGAFNIITHDAAVAAEDLERLARALVIDGVLTREDTLVVVEALRELARLKRRATSAS